MKMIISLLAILALAGAAWAAAGVDDGLFGDNPTYTVNEAVASGSSSATMWWDKEDGWIPVAGTGDEGLVAEAYIQLFASQTQQTTATFKWGTPPFTALTANLAGNIKQNHPCWIGIRKAGWVEGDRDTKASLMSKTQDPMGAHPELDIDDDIPLAFSLSVAGATATPMVWTGGVGSANWGWYSDARLPVGDVNYTIKVTATPQAYQADGYYWMDPEVVLVPDL